MAIDFDKQPQPPQPRLVQAHWQNPADPSDTVFVAQAEHSRYDEMNGWASEMFDFHRDSRPKGWVKMICWEGSPFFEKSDCVSSPVPHGGPTP